MIAVGIGLFVLVLVLVFLFGKDAPVWVMYVGVAAFLLAIGFSTAGVCAWLWQVAP